MTFQFQKHILALLMAVVILVGCEAVIASAEAPVTAGKAWKTSWLP